MFIKRILKFIGIEDAKPAGISLGRKAFRDIAYQFKLNQGFAGHVNRMHPADILPCAIGTMTLCGQAGIIDAATHALRPVTAADTTITDLYGITVRAYPFQQTAVDTTGGNTNPMNASGGVQQPLQTALGVCDVLRSGYIQVPVVGATAKGGAVYIWIGAAGGGHVVGGFESAVSAGNTIKLDGKSTYNGIPDANGLVEVAFNI